MWRFIIDNYIFSAILLIRELLTHEGTSYLHRLDVKLIVIIALVLLCTRRDKNWGSSATFEIIIFIYWLDNPVCL